ncbi:hypothetical protein [Pararhodospirillum oryzae]|uniref:Uncharacterized protein n=1 Tax=Pararhodospirillum oryzae TaxID=478448 RepID=A0A512H3H5_9PROT|nr:hypothetical protein [Pararhodospirillum oryzae]GEO79991.1 hypothetical protein ROR02_01220 [Pararhodospirillum oryzae]
MISLRTLRAAQPLPGVVLAGVAAVIATRLRYDLVEPEAMGAACQAAGPWWCGPRRGLIMLTEWKMIGLAALLLALLAWGRHLRRGDPTALALAALAVGGVGIVLYNATASTAALVAAGLVLALYRNRDATA